MSLSYSRAFAPFVSVCALALLAACSSSSNRGGAGGRDAGSGDGERCPAEQPADACGECGGDGSDCRHPLAGRYAARTQFYARQRTSANGSPLDLVSKGALLSLVEIDDGGRASERFCFLEISSAQGVVSWVVPETMQLVPELAVQLTDDGDQFVRATGPQRGLFSWSPESAPTDCVPGEQHASGCQCAEDELLPTRGNDCRVDDLDGDRRQGGKMYVTLGTLEDVRSTSALVSLNVVASLDFSWRLPNSAGDTLRGTIQGSIEQAELSRQGELASAVGSVKSAMCTDAEGKTLGQVELVRGDFSCDALLAGRAADRQGYGVFAAELDGEPPAVEACANPNCPAGDCPAP